MVPDFGRIMERKNEQVARFKRAKVKSIESATYDVIDGRGRFAGGGGVAVGDRRIEGRAYVVATGSRPVMLPIPGLDEVPVLTSDDVMRLDSPPARLLVQGAGPIGLELAQFFARIGTEVLLVNRSPLLCGSTRTAVGSCTGRSTTRRVCGWRSPVGSRGCGPTARGWWPRSSPRRATSRFMPTPC